MPTNLKDWRTTIPAIGYALLILVLSVWANHDPKDASDIHGAIALIGGAAAVHLGLGASSGGAK